MIAQHKATLLDRCEHQLSDSFTALNPYWVLATVLQNNADFTAIIGVDRSRCIGNVKTVPKC